MVEPIMDARPHAPQPEVASLDTEGLRALANPLRVQLVSLLRKDGPSTAARLAERLGVNSGTTSYHLRRLHAAGFVTEDTGRGTARERWWRSVHRATHFTDPALAAREPEAALAYLRSIATLYSARTERALNELETLPDVWRGAFDMSDWHLRLTPEEANALKEEIASVVARYRADAPEEMADAPEGVERVVLIAQLLPEPEIPDESGVSARPRTDRSR
ncbi:helix-turn-helix domain-containing protein [Nonomuraea sp. NPDC050451]|uniref:helix-turn-helix domain-containing protein n=1 Tax=Nonomuraea sp. NPDC050451 TaxID=3364364 RepID=UPI00378BA7F6